MARPLYSSTLQTIDTSATSLIVGGGITAGTGVVALVTAAGKLTSLNTTYVSTITANTSGKILQSDGTNYINSTPTYPLLAGTAGKVMQSDGTNFVMSTATFPTTVGALNTIIRSDGTNWVTSTPTFSQTPTSGTYFRGDGTNWITSTLVLPNAATVNQVVYATSTNTYGASANLTFDGTTLTVTGAAVATTSVSTPIVNAPLGTLSLQSNGTTDFKLVPVNTAYTDCIGDTMRPQALFPLSINSTGLTTPEGVHIDYLVTANPTAGTVRAFGVTTCTASGNAGNVTTLSAFETTVQHSGAGTLGTLRNLIQATAASAGPVTTMRALNVQGSTTSSSAITLANALTASLNASAGTGTITNAVSIDALMNIGASATVSTDVYYLRINNLTNAGTITGVTYGVRVGDITTGTQTGGAYSFYASDANALNFFAGNTTVNAILTVNGFGTHAFSSSGTGFNTISVTNTTAGTGNGGRVSINSDTITGNITARSSTFTTSGSAIQAGVDLVAGGVGGLSLDAASASGKINHFWAGATTAKAIFQPADISYVTTDGSTVRPQILFTPNTTSTTLLSEPTGVAIDYVLTATPTSVDMRGLSLTAGTVSGNAGNLSELRALKVNASHTGSGVVTVLSNVLKAEARAGSGNVTTLLGSKIECEIHGTQTVGTMAALQTAAAIDSAATVSGSVYGVLSGYSTTHASTVVSGSVHCYAVNTLVNSGTITGTTYGYHCGDITTGTQTGGAFSFFSSDVNAPCSFAGSTTSASFIPSGSTVPTNGMYLSASNTVALASNSVKFMSGVITGAGGVDQTATVAITAADSVAFSAGTMAISSAVSGGAPRSNTFGFSGGTSFFNFKSDSDITLTVGSGDIFTVALTGEYVVTGLGSDTGTDLIINASNQIKKKTSSRRAKENERMWDNPRAVLALQPKSFDYTHGAKGVLGFVSEDVYESGFIEAVNVDADGQPFSNRTDALLAAVVANLRAVDARLARLEQERVM